MHDSLHSSLHKMRLKQADLRFAARSQGSERLKSSPEILKTRTTIALSMVKETVILPVETQGAIGKGDQTNCAMGRCSATAQAVLVCRTATSGILFAQIGAAFSIALPVEPNLGRIPFNGAADAAQFDDGAVVAAVFAGLGLAEAGSDRSAAVMVAGMFLESAA